MYEDFSKAPPPPRKQCQTSYFLRHPSTHPGLPTPRPPPHALAGGVLGRRELSPEWTLSTVIEGLTHQPLDKANQTAGVFGRGRLQGQFCSTPLARGHVDVALPVPCQA